MLVQKGQYIKMYLFTSVLYIYVKISIYVSRFTYTYQDQLASTSSLINIDQLPLARIENQILFCNNVNVNFSEQALTANMQSNEQSLNLRTLPCKWCDRGSSIPTNKLYRGRLPGIYTELIIYTRFIPESVFYTRSVMLSPRFIHESMFYNQFVVRSP